MRVTTLIRWFWRVTVTGGLLYGVLSLMPLSVWSWRWMDFFQRTNAPCMPDTHFVIVDVGQLSRSQLAQLLIRIANQQPSVIAMDIYFPGLGVPTEDTLWSKALCEAGQRIPVYLAADLPNPMQPSTKPTQPISHAFFGGCTKTAYANLLFDEWIGGRVVRYARLYHHSEIGVEPSLALAAVQALDSSRLPSSLPAPVLPIRYRGNLACFYYLSGKDLIQDSLVPPIIANKAVFMGLADPFHQTLEDIFFSPLALRPIVLSNPDMYGVVIHANIASMILHGSFWQEVPRGVLWLGVGLVLLVLGLWIDTKPRRPWLKVRLGQLFFLVVGGTIFGWLSFQAYWVDAEIFFLGVLTAGEVVLATAQPS